MKQYLKPFLLGLLLCICQSLYAQDVFRHVTTEANVKAHTTTLNHPQLNGNPKAMLFILPNHNLNGAEAAGKDYLQNAGVRYNGSRWTIFNQNRKEDMPLNITFNVMIAPANDPNCFTFKVTEASLTGFGNGAWIDHPATNGKTNAMLLVTQNRLKVYNDASQLTFYSNGKWGIAQNGYFPYRDGQTTDARCMMPAGARFNVMVIENGAVPGFPNAQAFMHTANKDNTPEKGNWITYLEPANLVGNKDVMLFATAYLGHSDSDRTGPHQAMGPYNEGPLVAWYDHPDDRWPCWKDNYWSLYNSNSTPMEERAKINVVAVMSGSLPSPKDCCTYLFAPNASERDTTTITVMDLFGEGPEVIKVEVVGGYVIFQGDMVLGLEKDFFTRSRGKLIPITNPQKPKSNRDTGTPDPGRLWPGGVIPFEIVAGHPSASVINRAIETINRTTNLCMRPRTNEVDFVRFTNLNGRDDGGCWAWIGRRGGMQEINIGNGCGDEGVILHEILHAAGVFHEQSRPDRDNYVRINWNNILPRRANNFGKLSRAFGVCSYDFRSIMHYGQFDFNSNGLPTITTIDPTRQNVIGQRNGLSECDINGLRFLYPNARGCRIDPPPTFTLTIFPQPNFVGISTSRRFNASTDNPQIPASFLNQPISIDIAPGWVAILTTACGAEFPETRVIFRNEPNITFSDQICRIELVPVVAEGVLSIPDFGRRCPTQQTRRGDSEFAGNGPALYCRALIWADLDNRINLRVNFVASEIGGDSYVEDAWNSVLLNVPSDMRVLAIDRQSSGTVGDIPIVGPIDGGLIRGFRSKRAGDEFIFCNEGQVHLSGQDFQLRGDLVREMEIIGDTGGQDINSGNCGCDTGIRNIRFNPVRVYLGAR
ncbi:MAG: M12 family metallopeptidase [Saprospiraceae bacterium]